MTTPAVPVEYERTSVSDPESVATVTVTPNGASGAPDLATVLGSPDRTYADSSRRIRLEQRTQPLDRVPELMRRRPASMDLMPFLDGPEHVADIVRRVLAHGGSPVDIGEPGPGSLHTGHEAGLHYDVLTRSVVAEVVPELIFLHDNAASALLRAITQDDGLVPLPGERGININITRNQDVHEWHVGGPDLAYTSSTGLLVPTVGAGLPGRWTDYAKVFEPGSSTPARDANGVIEVGTDTPGAFVFHDGVEKHATLIEPGRCLVAPGLMPHGVNAVPPGFTRITLIMSWCWREDLEAAEAKYGRTEEKQLADYLYGEGGHKDALKADERPSARDTTPGNGAPGTRASGQPKGKSGA